MSENGTAEYAGETGLPELVHRAVRAAGRAGFGCSCRPAQGRLLRLLAGGVAGGTIGETGTGFGVGLAWLAAGAGPGTALVGIERDRERHTAAAEVFAGEPAVTLLRGYWTELAAAPGTAGDRAAAGSGPRDGRRHLPRPRPNMTGGGRRGTLPRVTARPASPGT
jgi:hypothetical protein